MLELTAANSYQIEVYVERWSAESNVTSAADPTTSYRIAIIERHLPGDDCGDANEPNDRVEEVNIDIRE